MIRSLCRLFVIPAREAPIAVILRRGPSRWFHVILWETRRDAFTPGAWFHGRIYPERCDLSPDGSLLAYFAFRADRLGTTYTDAWTAVSRPPWLDALALWPWGSTWGGGGRFLGNRALRLHVNMPVEPHPDHRPANLRVLCEGPQAEYHTPGDVVPGADWSGYDHRGFIIYASGGRLFRRGKGRGASDTLILDLNDLEPERQPAPEWARRPL